MTRETKIDSEDGAMVGDFGYEYDSDGKVTTLFLLDSGTKVEYKYDEHGNQISSVLYYSNGNIETSGLRGYSYDEKGRIVCKFSYLATGEVTSKTEYEYDANGNVTHEIYTDGEGNIGKEEEYSYDENGNMTRHLSYYRGIVRRRIEYGANGTVISNLSFYQDGNVSGEIKYEYSNPTVVYLPTTK